MRFLQGEPPVLLRVLAVHRQRLFCDLLSDLLSQTPGFACVGTATDLVAAIRLVQAECPDVVLLGVTVSGEDDLAAIPQLRATAPRAAIVAINESDEPHWMACAHLRGAVGFISRGSSAKDILDVLRLVRRGSNYATPSVAEADRLAETTAAAARIRLTPREWAVLHHLGQGMTVPLIAKNLGISAHTCRGYVKALRSKLNATSLVTIVLAAQRLGLIKMPELGKQASA